MAIRILADDSLLCPEGANTFTFAAPAPTGLNAIVLVADAKISFQVAVTRCIGKGWRVPCVAEIRLAVARAVARCGSESILPAFITFFRVVLYSVAAHGIL